MEKQSTQSRNMFPTEEQSAQYLSMVAGTGDTILQTFRMHDDPYAHVLRILDKVVSRRHKSLEWYTTRVLDVGCGTGEVLWHIRNVNPEAECIGYNFYDSQAELGRSRGLEIHTCDWRKAAVEENKFNLVLCNYTLGYFDRKDYIQALCKIHNAMVPEALLCIWDVAPRTMVCDELFDYKLRTQCEVFHALKLVFGDAAHVDHFTMLDDDVVVAESFKAVASEQQIELFRKYARPVLYVVDKPKE